MKRVIKASNKARHSRLTRKQFEVRKDELIKQRYSGSDSDSIEGVPHGPSLYYSDIVIPDESLSDWCMIESVTASTGVKEPFKVGDVVLLNAAFTGWQRNHFILLIVDALLQSDGSYKYDGVPATSANKLSDGSIKEYSGSIIVDDFNSHLTDSKLKDSRAAYIQYENPVSFSSSDLAAPCALMGSADPALVDYVTKLFAGEIADPPSYYDSTTSDDLEDFSTL